MKRAITGFHQDDAGDWVAELACGHHQHVRHDPPWQVRPWVMDPAGREGRLGTPLECPLCDRPSLEDTDEYRDARMRGLCHEGALEVARSAHSDLGDR